MAGRTGESANNSFVFYQSFLDAIEMIPTPEDKLKAYQFIIKYGINGEIPTSDNSMAYMIFIMAKPNIDVNNKKKENGRKGGAPEGNTNAEKSRDKLGNQYKTTNGGNENNQRSEKKTSNEDVNENVNENEDETEKKKYLDYVYLSDGEYKNIQDRYGERILKDFIERLDCWIGENPDDKKRKKKSHYKTILNRIKREGIKELPKKQENESGIYDLPF